MSDREIFDNAENWSGMPPNIAPADAWEDMRRRLDEEMPKPVFVPPAFVIYAGNGLLRSMASLFILLFVSSIGCWLFNTSNLKMGEKANNMPLTHKVNTSITHNTAKQSFNINNKLNQIPTEANLQEHEINKKTSNYSVARPIPKNGITLVNKDVSASKKMPFNDTTTVVDITKNTAALLTESKAKSNNTYTHKNNTIAGNKVDSLPQVAKPVEKNTEAALELHAGLQWAVQLPLSATEHYFAGPGGPEQPFRLLLPSAWFSIQANKYLLLAEVNPFATTVYKPRPFMVTTSQGNAQTIITQTQTLSKLFGVSTTIRGSYNAAGNWWVGGGLQAYFWAKGVTTNSYITDSSGIKKYYTTIGTVNNEGWQHLFKFNVRADAELLYKKNKWQAGLRTGVFVMPVASNNNGPKNLFVVEIFYRFSLLNIGNPIHNN